MTGLLNLGKIVGIVTFFFLFFALILRCVSRPWDFFFLSGGTYQFSFFLPNQCLGSEKVSSSQNEEPQKKKKKTKWCASLCRITRPPRQKLIFSIDLSLSCACVVIGTTGSIYVIVFSGWRAVQSVFSDASIETYVPVRTLHVVG